jgi:hypothetical protein
MEDGKLITERAKRAIETGIFHEAFQLRMDNVWFCKLLLLFEVESKSDIGFKKHLCAFVAVVEEYDGQRRPGTLFNLRIVLRQLRQLRLLRSLRLLSVLGLKLSFNEW